jgi:hypothetical protein
LPEKCQRSLGLAGYGGRGSSFFLAAIWSDFPGKQGSLRKTALLAMGIHAAIAKNKKEHCYEPIALKTMQDG